MSDCGAGHSAERTDPKVERRVELVQGLELVMARDTLMDAVRLALRRAPAGGESQPGVEFLAWLQLQPDRVAIDIAAAHSVVTEAEVVEARDGLTG